MAKEKEAKSRNNSSRVDRLAAKGRQALKKGDFDRVRRVFEQVYKTNERPEYLKIGDEIILDVLGHSYEQLGEMDKAKESYEDAAEYYDSLGHKYASGVLYEKAGKPEKALKVLKDELEHDKQVHNYGLRDTKEKNISRLEGKVAAPMAIIGLIAGIFFISSNITGNVVGNLTNSTSNIIGAVLLVAGLVGSFFYFRKK
tara:strand:- start:811 stop:1407 length:597 start_codon:yes stop_codon:yes gene_type:complete